MKALVYQGPGKKALEERPVPTIAGPTDAITHRFRLDHILDAYDTFAQAASTRALRVIIEA